ncbi:MAG: hypothetical protein ABIF19_01375 [Planctomycetota bacterium]
MNLVKWFRKNNKKVMAVVVIVLMIGFVGGSELISMLEGGNPLSETVARLGKNVKVTNQDLHSANLELEMLKMLRIDYLLKSQDLPGILLGELLFSEQRASPMFVNQLKQTIRQNQYIISDKQINDIYRRQFPPNVYWYCLQKETQLAGISIPNSEVGELLGKLIPQLFEGQTYSQRIGAIMKQSRIPQEQILTTVGKLLAVLQYSHMICSNEDVTTQQIMHAAGAEEEGIDVAFVKFDSAVFAKAQDQPGEAQLVEHFDKYKKFFAGDVSEENPYCLGYKLPDRVQLEYIAVKLDDVRTIAKLPTQDDLEEYYDRNKEELFTQQVPSDPNDPNSPLMEKRKSYAEVAGTISDQLLKNRINSTAERILQEARTLTDPNLTDTESGKVTAEQLKDKVGKYETAARQLSEKHKIKVYSGRTGLLSAVDMQMDKQLATLYQQGTGGNPVRLSQIVFAVEELAASELGVFDIPKPKLYENIGPVKDMMAEIRGPAGTIMAIVRVVKAEKASEPESINQTFSTKPLSLDPNQADADKYSYSVREKVVEDVKKLAAMDTAKTEAREFVDLAKKGGWENSLKKLNELHKQDANEPDSFKLENLRDLRRTSRAALETLAVQGQGNPATAFFLNENKKDQMFTDVLYSLVPADTNDVPAVPLVVEFKPDIGYYAVKSISVSRLWKEDYEKTKAMRLYREDHVQSQSMAPVHFNPENILKRTNFKLVRTTPTDSNTPAESEAAL